MSDNNGEVLAWHHETHPYIEDAEKTDLRTVETWTRTAPTADGYWIIYIHGGAWWRPMITSSSFALTVQHLIKSPLASHINGFASLNYRLSTPPPLPQFAQFTEPDKHDRNVRHPFHLMDVMTGLQYLQQEYGFQNKYILIGHSCGATLAFQIPDGIGIHEPAAILGVEGIYDLKRLRDDFVGVDIYQYFIESAFGKDEEEWRKASPTTQQGPEGFAGESPGGFIWEEAKVVALAQSADDELVNDAQRDVMWDVVKRSNKVGRRDLLIDLKGKHDEIWREANPEPQLKVAIEEVFKALM